LGLTENKCPCTDAQKLVVEQKKTTCLKAAAAKDKERRSGCDATRGDEENAADLSSTVLGLAAAGLTANIWVGAGVGIGIDKFFGKLINKNYNECIARCDTSYSADEAECDAIKCQD
jgi:hypothetical protein